MIGTFILAIVFFVGFRAIGFNDKQSTSKNFKELRKKDGGYIVFRIIVVILAFILI